MHDTTLTIRLPKALHAQFEQVANAQYMKMGELIRQLMKDHVKQAQPFIGASPQPQTFNKPKPIINKPSQQVDWNDPDQVRQAKAIHQYQEAQRKAKTEAYLEALRNGEIPPEEDDPWA